MYLSTLSSITLTVAYDFRKVRLCSIIRTLTCSSAAHQIKYFYTGTHPFCNLKVSLYIQVKLSSWITSPNLFHKIVYLLYPDYLGVYLRNLIVFWFTETCHMDIDSSFQCLSKSLTILVVCNLSLFLLINSLLVSQLRQGNWQQHKVATRSTSYKWMLSRAKS